MAEFMCKAGNKIFLVKNCAYQWQATLTVANLVPKGTDVTASPIDRFVTVYGEYFELKNEGGQTVATRKKVGKLFKKKHSKDILADKRPVTIHERKNGQIVTYLLPQGLSDTVKVPAIDCMFH